MSDGAAALEKWVAKRAKRADRIVALEESLLAGGFVRYALRRLAESRKKPELWKRVIAYWTDITWKRDDTLIALEARLIVARAHQALQEWGPCFANLKAARLTDGRLGAVVRRVHTCWRCDQAISAYTAYCGQCRWLVCEACQACGCQHPDWQRRTEPAPQHPLLDRVGPLSRLGWILVAGLGSVFGMAGAVAWAVMR